MANRDSILRLQEQQIAEQATGCRGAGGYRAWAEAQGYPQLAVIDWTSSAGDWSFIVSEDGEVWYIMYQTNNFPRSGFTWSVNLDQAFYGSEESVLEEISRMF